MGYAATTGAVGRNLSGTLLTPQTLTYSTTFPAAENPISQSARWLNGAADGGDWSNVETTTGKAFGTQSGTIGPPYNDSVALLQPASGQVWGADQSVVGQVFITSRSGWASFKEVECLLRGTMIPSNPAVTGAPNTLYLYEVLFSVVAGTTYIEIVRWNGKVGQSLADFTFLKSKQDWAGLSDGTYVRGQIIGTTIEAATSSNGTDWTTQLTADIITDAPDGRYYTTGYPGIGFWNRQPTNGANNTFGFSSWSVTA